MEKSLLGKRRSDQREGLRKDTKLRSSPLQCPICDVTLRPESLNQHYEHELAKLEHLQPPSTHQRRREPRPSTSSTSAEGVGEEESGILKQAKMALESVQRRRFLFEQRSHDQSLSLPQSLDSPAHSNSGVCPVCGVQLPSDGSAAAHVDVCLEQQQTGLRQEDGAEEFDSDSSGEEYEEYTWCNQTRIRATSLLTPQTRASMFNASVISRPSDTSFEETVDVEGDSSALYGPAQFSEEDLVKASGGEKTTEEMGSDLERSTVSNTAASSSSLLAGVCERKMLQCLVCMDSYENPLVSVQCWHVYCEQCWLKALATKKLCPKCKTITCSGDLRRIFL